GGSSAFDATASLSKAGTATLSLSRNPLLTGPLRVRLDYGAPGAATAKHKTLTVHVRRLPAPRVPRLLAVEAHRAGDDVVVTWSTDTPVPDLLYSVIGTHSRNRADDFKSASGRGRNRTHFRARLRHARRVRYVQVFVRRPGTYITHDRQVKVTG